MLAIFYMFLTPEMGVLAHVFQFFRACGTLFFQKTFSLQAREGAAIQCIFCSRLRRAFLLKVCIFASDRRRRCSLYFILLRLRHAFLLTLFMR